MTLNVPTLAARCADDRRSNTLEIVLRSDKACAACVYTPGPPVRDKYWVSLGLNSNGKLGERAFAGPRAGAPDISWPQVGMGPHS